MKKLSIVLVLCLLVGLFAGCGSQGTPGGETTSEPFKIAIATIFEGESWEIQKTYYETEVGPALNMEFMISEKLADANGLIDFMERAYAAGCVGIINFITSNDAVAQGARKAEEWGMWFVTQNSALNEDVAMLEHNLGHCGGSAADYSVAYNNAISGLVSDGESHSLFIFSGAAVGGAIGQGAASHYYSVQGMLEAMQKKYNLTYEKSIDEIINNQDPSEIATGNPDVKIYIYPGTDVNAAMSAVQTQFQTGSYDIFAAVFGYSIFTNAISDIEKSLNKDIKIIGTANIESQTATGFTTLDSQGDTVLNAAVVNPLNGANAVCAVLLYNALTGHADAMKDNGKAVLFKSAPWDCQDAETYKMISQLDSSPETYIMGAADLRALCVEDNANVTYKDIEAKLVELADVNAVIAAKIG